MMHMLLIVVVWYVIVVGIVNPAMLAATFQIAGCVIELAYRMVKRLITGKHDESDLVCAPN